MTHQFTEPPITTTPHQRRKFVVLVVLAGIILILFWILTLPFNLKAAGSASGPKEFFSILSNQISQGTALISDAKKNNQQSEQKQ